MALFVCSVPIIKKQRYYRTKTKKQVEISIQKEVDKSKGNYRSFPIEALSNELLFNAALLNENFVEHLGFRGV